MTFHVTGLALLIFLLGVPQAHAHKSAAQGDMAEEVLAGGALLADGDSQAAGYHFTQALKVQEAPGIYTLVLLALLQGRDVPAARRMCAMKTGLALRDPHFHYWCARFAWDAGDPSGAITAIENALSLGGGKPHVLMAASIMHFARGDKAKAARYFTTLVKKDPWILRTRLYPLPAVGGILAIEDLLASGDFGARLPHALGALAMRASDPGLSDEYLQQAWKAYATPPESLHQLRHQVLRALGRTAQADTALDEGLRAYPRSVYLRTQAALRLLDAGSMERARTRLEEILVDVPSDPLVLSLLAYAQLETAQIAKARRTLDYAKSQDAQIPMFHFARAMLAQKSGAPAEALADFARAVQMEPTSRRFSAAYLAALAASRDAAKIRQEEERQKALEAFLRETQEFEKKLQERVGALERLARDVAAGKAVFPTPCDVQCQVLQGAKSLRDGKAWNPAPVLAKLSSRPPWAGDLPPHAWKKEARAGMNGEKIVLIKYFGSVLPMALD